MKLSEIPQDKDLLVRLAKNIGIGAIKMLLNVKEQNMIVSASYHSCKQLERLQAKREALQFSYSGFLAGEPVAKIWLPREGDTPDTEISIGIDYCPFCGSKLINILEVQGEAKRDTPG